MKREKHLWNYSGDVNLEHGGLYWRETGHEGDDYVLAVKVTPCSAGGGPDNLFYIEEGTIYIGDNAERIASALATIGMTSDEASRNDLVYALDAYGGIERDSETVVRIGRDESDYVRAGGWNPEPDVKMRAGSSLERYVKREFL